LKFKAMMNRVYDFIQNEGTFMVVNFLQLLGVILVINHLLACGWYAIGFHYWTNNKVSWFDQKNLMDHPVEYRYATSIHWCLTQFTPAGMGVSATNFGERIFSICVVLFAMVAFSSIVGGITSFITELRRMSHNENREMWLMRLYLRQHKVSKSLISRIIKYIDHRNRVKKNCVQKEAVPCLKGLSQELTSQLTLEICRHQLLCLPLFKILNNDMLPVMLSICSEALSFQSFAENDVIFCSPSLAKKVYFLNSGVLEYVFLNEMGEARPLDPSPMPREAISEPVLWMEWIHQGALTALTLTELVLLDPDAFGKTMSMNTQPWMLAVKYAEQFLTFLNSLKRTDFIDIIRTPFSFESKELLKTQLFEKINAAGSPKTQLFEKINAAGSL